LNRIYLPRSGILAYWNRTYDLIPEKRKIIMRHYLYKVIIHWAIAIYAVTFIGCSAHNMIADNCETRAVNTAMKLKRHDIPHRLAVGDDHVAVQILKGGEWKFVHIQDAKCFQPVEFVSLQRYMEYLIIRYNVLDKIKRMKNP
jgi:hypothetical protein